MIKKAVFCDICGNPYRTIPEEQNSTFVEHSMISKTSGVGFPMEMRYKAGALVEICPDCNKALQRTLNRLSGVEQ